MINDKIFNDQFSIQIQPFGCGLPRYACVEILLPYGLASSSARCHVPSASPSASPCADQG